MTKYNICYIDNIYDAIKDNVPSFIEENQIYTSYALFSTLEHLLKYSYNFFRPYIFVKSLNFYNKESMILSFVKDKSEVSVLELTNFINELNLSGAGILNIVNDMNDMFIFENKNNIINISNKKIYHIFEQIESIIIEELKGRYHQTSAIVDIECIRRLEFEGNKWDEWFIYSVINKYSRRIYTYTSNRMFQHCIPILSLQSDVPDDYLSYLGETRKNIKINKIKRINSIEEIEIDIDDEYDLFNLLNNVNGD